jgi:transcriptional regulator of acetoin/glycerol metabolism
MILDALLARHGVETALAAPLVHALMTRWWSGNVRELDSVIERLVALSTYRSERPSMDLLRRALPEEDSPPPEIAGVAPPPVAKPVRARPTQAELIEALEETGWNRSEVARRFGRDPRQVRRWIALYGLEQPAD